MFVESLVETLQRRRILETFQEIFVTVAYASNAKNYIFTKVMNNLLKNFKIRIFKVNFSFKNTRSNLSKKNPFKIEYWTRTLTFINRFFWKF